MNKIAILYICTGKYTVFWENFYLSFKKNFCPKSQKTFYVFTDAESILFENNEDVVKVFQERLGWPYDTLMRFEMFSKVHSELEKKDYIYFFNANMICTTIIAENEVLPDENLGQKLVVVKHPGYGTKKFKYCPLERNPRSLAYIPYNRKGTYICGGVNGGARDAYLELIDILRHNINEDLKNNIIAIFHDESHINHYVSKRKDVRYLGPEYCNPDDVKTDYELKIELLDKKKVLDINGIRNTKDESTAQKWKRRIIKYAKCECGYIRDTLLKRV